MITTGLLEYQKQFYTRSFMDKMSSGKKFLRFNNPTQAEQKTRKT